jgi:hypothetical protein
VEPMTTTLQYRPFVYVEQLSLNECTIHRAANADARWWLLWFYVLRETDSIAEDFAVPVNPNGAYTKDGVSWRGFRPVGRTWGLTRTSMGVWQISPSINVVSDFGVQRVVAGPPARGRSIWHQTPTIVGVPESEPWITGPP